MKKNKQAATILLSLIITLVITTVPALANQYCPYHEQQNYEQIKPFDYDFDELGC